MNVGAVKLVIGRAVQLFMLIGNRKSMNLFTGVIEVKAWPRVERPPRLTAL